MKQIVLLTLLATCFTAMAQNRSIHGMVSDAETNEPLAFCNIVWLSSDIGTYTNGQGKFQIDVPAGVIKPVLIISYLGYETDTIEINASVNEYNVRMARKQGKLNEVVVTGVSKASLARENPVTVVTVSQHEIEQTIEDNTIDAIAKNAPGLEVVKTGPNVSKPFINGEGYNRVLTLYDGVLRIETQQWGDEHGVPMDDYIMERAEVVEGPASLMYGSDAIAGVLSLFTALPKDTDKMVHGRFISEYQTNNGLTGNSLSLNYASRHWAFAVRGSARLAQNYSDPVEGRVYNTGFRMGNGSAFAGYQNKKGYTHINFTIYDNRQGIPDGSRDSLTRKFTYQVYESGGENTILQQVDTITSRPVVQNNVLNSYNISRLSQRIQDYRVYTDNLYNLGQGDIKAILGYEQNIRREYNHPTDPGQAGEYIVLNTIDYGLRYNTPSFFNIEPAIGVTGMYQTNTNKNATDFPIPDYRLFDVGGVCVRKVETCQVDHSRRRKIRPPERKWRCHVR